MNCYVTDKMAAFERINYRYHLGNRDLSSWFGYGELDLRGF